MTNSNRINVPLIAKNIEDAHKKLASKELDPFFTRDVTEQIHQCLEDQIALDRWLPENATSTEDSWTTQEQLEKARQNYQLTKNS
ncbi:hypothetical protein [Synechococcus sp. WH 8016]|uniref:hypothetical protein n=1 Tax=Synechococcus sp. WH 8016 TaxID=166318 RepID=UPI00022DA17F|nr:hypothetical protein [Synechococcus sp. WH 8016]EHA64065.1 hypothetical protein Syn8016DRAFT_1107 [Synechococcus sp. WH 8016]